MKSTVEVNTYVSFTSEKQAGNSGTGLPALWRLRQEDGCFDPRRGHLLT